VLVCTRESADVLAARRVPRRARRAPATKADLVRQRARLGQRHPRPAEARAAVTAAMLGIHDYGLFVLSAILLILAPGQDTLYILGRSIGQGRRIGIASALGVSAGTLVHTFAAALGLSAIVAASGVAFLAIKVVGAAYLVYLGV